MGAADPIGFFDSGVGGLCVRDAVRALLPREDTLYIADSAHCPYGNKPAEEIRALARGHVRTLLAEGCKLVVVACNTATAAAIDALRAEWPDVPFVGMEPAEPALFVLACCLCSLNFACMNYALVYALDNVGMALSVIIMVIQVAGSGGSYPIHVLPQIFQTLYPFMPFHYGMDMIRETVGGMYGHTYRDCALVLLGMCVLFTVLGLVLYYPARRLNAAIAASKEKSGIM